jgi:hypothetical protein
MEKSIYNIFFYMAKCAETSVEFFGNCVNKKGVELLEGHAMPDLYSAFSGP